MRAQPGAKKTAIVGVYGEGDAAQLKIAVQAPPVEGRANEALVAFLAETFGMPKRSVELVSGEFSRSKVFLLAGVSLQAVQYVQQLGCYPGIPPEKKGAPSIRRSLSNGWEARTLKSNAIQTSSSAVAKCNRKVGSKFAI